MGFDCAGPPHHCLELHAPLMSLLGGRSKSEFESYVQKDQVENWRDGGGWGLPRRSLEASILLGSKRSKRKGGV